MSRGLGDVYKRQHNLYHADFTPYDQEELDILKKCNEDKNIWK